MKIIAKVYGEDPNLVETLVKRQVSAKLVKGAVIVELPELKGSYTYEIPKEIMKATFCIDISECGGGMTNTGSGQIVCGLDGRALRPYYVPRGGSLCNGNHAYFAIPDGLVTINGENKCQNVVIQEHRIEVSENTAKIVSKDIWSGNHEDLPTMFSKFESAALAAVRKSNCYHCRCVHFAVTDK